MATAPPNTQALILDRAFGLSTSSMSPEAARYFLAVKLDPQDEQRANELAQLARDGSLSEEQQAEIDEYRRVGRVMELLKLRASAVLKQSP